MIAPPNRPINEDAERGVLSSLLKGDVMALALDEGINDETFTTPLRKELWQTMVSLDKDKEQIDEVSMMQRLGERMIALGKDEVWNVFNACDTASFMDKYAKAARESERLRRIQSLALEVLDKVSMKEKSPEVAEYADRS